MTAREGQLAGLRALVTGGAAGIGAAIVDALLASGATVAVLDREVDDAVADERPGVTLVRADVSDREGVENAVRVAEERLGGIDIVVNNAAVGAQGDIAANDDEEWARVLSINVTGIARVSAAALPALRRSRAAAVCNVASIAAGVGLPQRALYSASKGAVAALTRAMAADHIREGIRVNSVSPGTADTPWVQRLLAAAADPVAERAALEARQPHGRLVSAAEVAGAVLYLVSPLSGSTTGTVLDVDGGVSGLRLRPVDVK
ncbi:SDR family oxidoreductase [uncultured Microbacterium sp.]|uniref:SDR family NAD(P)-dependent oxidoreductase n=1 Tax=uncultured Microbacterium sp. TaxID=191216 RepID=UPI0028D0AB11|nr:SDR family oxidoreductase [uncultured Microbacterium sp.]